MKRRSHDETLRIGGKSVSVKVRLNPRARRLIVKVHPSTGEVAVIAPSERSVHKALDFARQEGDWIAGRLARVPTPVYLEPGDTVLFKGALYVLRLSPERGGSLGRQRRDAPDDPHLRPPRTRAAPRRRLAEEASAQPHPAPRQRARPPNSASKPARITVRDAASRWGSCSTTRRDLVVLAPDHGAELRARTTSSPTKSRILREMNHGTRFWRLVDRLVGENEAASRPNLAARKRHRTPPLQRPNAQAPPRGLS